MIVEIHELQNLAPSNVNRDDTGAPKECDFGGVTRARISSQSLKRAMRTAFKDQKLIDPAYIGVRTQRAHEAITEQLAQQHPREDAKKVAKGLIEYVLKLNEKGAMPYLVLFAQQELDAAATLCHQHWDALMLYANSGETKASKKSEVLASEDGKGESKVGKKNESLVPPDVKKAFERLMDGRGAADLALFGRMIADIPQRNVEAASQVAHAISTHAISREMDYFTAVDDLKGTDTSGAGMIGTVEFNSACFYRYANVDTTQLLGNLGGDHQLARQTLAAYLRAMVTAIPSGKQNSMAAQNPPSLVMVVVREAGMWSLANAFVRPVHATETHDLVVGSIMAMDAYWGKLTKMYGTNGIQLTQVAMLDDVALRHLAQAQVTSVDQMYASVLEEAFARGVTA